jgi:hypothetical protein
MTWQHFETEKAARDHCQSFRVHKVYWTVPGWYYIKTYTQRCPRNCCDDNVIKITHASDRVKEVKEEIRELADELRTAKSKC